MCIRLTESLRQPYGGQVRSSTTDIGKTSRSVLRESRAVVVRSSSDGPDFIECHDSFMAGIELQMQPRSCVPPTIPRRSFATPGRSGPQAIYPGTIISIFPTERRGIQGAANPASADRGSLIVSYPHQALFELRRPGAICQERLDLRKWTRTDPPILRRIALPTRALIERQIPRRASEGLRHATTARSAPAVSLVKFNSSLS